MKSGDMSRRSFLAQAGTTGAAALVSASEAASRPISQEDQSHLPPASQPDGDKPELRVRKDISRVSADEVETYRKAILAMKSLKANDPKSWEFQSGVHGNPFEQLYPYIFNQCQHTQWWFFPWHRMYLYYAERIMRKLLLKAATSDEEKRKASEFTIPFWNYLPAGKARLLPEPFRNPANYDNALWEPRRGPGINDGDEASKLPATSVDIRAFCYTNFYSDGPGFSFGGRRVDRPVHLAPELVGFDADTFENNPHNSVHAWVGAKLRKRPPRLFGYMSSPPYAALDPIFWLHHSNVDRLWEVWLSLGEGRQNPPATTADGKLWRQQTFLFLDENENPQAGRVEDFLDIRALGYSYGPTEDPDFTAACKDRILAGQPPKARRFTILAGTALPGAPAMAGHAEDERSRTSKPYKLGTKSDVVTVKILEANRDLAKRATPAADQPKLFLTVEGIRFDEPPGAYFEVFLNVPEGQVPDPKGPHYLGTLTFFSLQSHGRQAGHGHDGVQEQGGASVRFDITDTVQKLRNAKRWKGDEVRVTFVQRAPGTQPDDNIEATFRDVVISLAQ